jgi:DNA (cytosine-5)-methyltransferase 1
LTVLSTFTGAGGFDLGLESAGFETVACIECDRHARSTIRMNRPQWNLLDTADILDVASELTPQHLGIKQKQLGLLVGGPPCQPFSTAAQWADGGRAGITDPRSLTLLAFLELTQRFLPSVILIENVPGFVQGRTSALPIITSELRLINTQSGTRYQPQWRIIDAGDYGVPQHRRRAILVARRDGKPFEWPGPTHLGRPVRAYDAIWNVSPPLLPQSGGQWTELLASIPAGMNYQYHTSRGKGVPLFGYRSWFWSFLLKLAPDQPAWTISAQGGPSTGPFHWDNRPLSIEELARLQTFPASWRFEGTRSAQKRQVGNATPPLLAEVIGRALAEQVFERRFSHGPKLSISRKRQVPDPPKPTKVPAKFLNRIGSQADHPGVAAGPGAVRRKAQILHGEFAALLLAHCSRKLHARQKPFVVILEPSVNQRFEKLASAQAISHSTMEQITA